MSLKLKLGVARPESRGAANKSQKHSGRAGQPRSSTASDGSFMLGKHLSKELREKILKRDANTCQYCAFQSDKYQNIHHIDHNLNNHDEDNLVSACVFCQQCFHLDHVGQMESGVLIWLPEIEQAQLHHIARAIYVGRISQGDMAEASRKAYDALLLRREEAINRISTDNPYILSIVLKDYLSSKQYSWRTKKLDGIRLLPLDKRLVQEGELNFNQFPQILAYWRSKNGPFGGKAPQEWISITQNLLAQAAAA